MWARLKLSINIAQEAEAACLDVGGYLVEPRSKNREQHLEDIAEVRNPETAFLQPAFKGSGQIFLGLCPK